MGVSIVAFILKSSRRCARAANSWHSPCHTIGSWFASWSLLHGPLETSFTSHLHALSQRVSVVCCVVVFRGFEGGAEMLTEHGKLGLPTHLAAHPRVPHRVDDGAAEQRIVKQS